MGLKQVKKEERIVFLTEFTSMILKEVSHRLDTKRRIESAKLRQRFITPNISPEDAFRKIIQAPNFKPSPYQAMSKVEMQQAASRPKQPKKKGPRLKDIKEIIARHIKKKPPQGQKVKINVRPQSAPRPSGFNLGRIELLIKDPAVQTIECSGPGRNVLLKRHNKINTTQITLTQDEITEVINKFSKEARIPVIGGLFKAAVGELIISAVISEFVGSRFIINKIASRSKIIN
ncbi:hypothetical protein GOV14_06215 [Candidatus Pacearchaeota archaeon]|nr:hypothetical protein [Candidatus Pacearchaeota archaeon]